MLPENIAIVFHKNHYVILCNKIRYYADRAFRQRGLFFRRWGTGRTRGLGFDSLLLALAVLAVSLGVTLLVDRMPVPARRRPAAVAPGGYSQFGFDPGVAPAFYGPGR